MAQSGRGRSQTQQREELVETHSDAWPFRASNSLEGSNSGELQADLPSEESLAVTEPPLSECIEE